MLVGGKEFLHQLKDTEVNFVVVGKPNTILINAKFGDLPTEVCYFLNDHMDVIVYDFPNEFTPFKSISHHIDLIPAAFF